MDIKFTVTYTADFDLIQAEQDFYEMLYWDHNADVDKLLYSAVVENIAWPSDVDDLPDEVVEEVKETAETALRKRIGGIQLEMELN